MFKLIWDVFVCVRQPVVWNKLKHSHRHHRHITCSKRKHIESICWICTARVVYLTFSPAKLFPHPSNRFKMLHVLATWQVGEFEWDKCMCANINGCLYDLTWYQLHGVSAMISCFILLFFLCFAFFLWNGINRWIF